MSYTSTLVFSNDFFSVFIFCFLNILTNNMITDLTISYLYRRLSITEEK